MPALSREDEAGVMAALVVHLPDCDAGFRQANAIVGELIEIGVVDPDLAEAVLVHWYACADLIDDVDQLRRQANAVYLGLDID